MRLRSAGASQAEDDSESDGEAAIGSNAEGGDGSAGSGRQRRQWRRQPPPPAVQPWEELVYRGRPRSRFIPSSSRPAAATAFGSAFTGSDGGSGTAGNSSSVLTLRTHQHVAALGWDPRRPGRLALVDRSTPQVTLLDLGAGPGAATAVGGGAAGAAGVGFNGGSGQGPNYRRSYLTAAPASANAAGGGAARALTYMRYGSQAATYTLAAAGRASGDGAVVHLWDERRGRTPVSRLASPGGAALVAPLEPSADGTALLGVVHPGTLVVWDVRRASAAEGGGALLSLGSSAPSASAVVATADVLGPLAAAGCLRPVLSSLATDPRDTGRVALLTQQPAAAAAAAALASGPASAVLPAAVAAAAVAARAGLAPGHGAGLWTATPVPGVFAAAAGTAPVPAAYAVAARLDDWPLCAASLAATGDVVCGTVGGHLVHWRKG
ncbi:hypothetical protein GPECTOR_16g632 [Gonium pectorale]|uniref:Uncharacterized protein n=1 Tax=Gonium pectorale TaxID=33097 RepID=A0A150GL00_GONPE|nr:hypothetical protein GPECTOR_16g632 [Gonium pectorale]|eukprot:KXZ50458.1 hypothetical protein GPECTOR_16g632 [Gonium pectorale]